jgi:hypothetical protein
MSKAYLAGLKDGADWDLSGFQSPVHAVRLRGWDDATISAMGASACRKAWGVPLSSEAGDGRWGKACGDYNRGCRDAVGMRVITRERIEKFRAAAAEAGDMVAVAVCQIALSEEVTADLNEHDRFLLEELDLESESRARAAIAKMIVNAEVQS